MGGTAVRRGGWVSGMHRMAGGSYGVGTVAGLLGFLSLAELAVRTELDRISVMSLVMTESVAGTASGWLVLGLLCLATTLPAALARPALAAVAVDAAAVASFVLLHMLTIPGACAQLVAGYRLGRSDSRALGVVLGVPFLALALLGPPVAGIRPFAVLLASLVPASVIAGNAGRARGDAQEHTAERQAFAGILLQHTAQAERARIVRELHDVVAHHISLIAVQAETARLTTAGITADGARRLLAIGDTAREALTEMRRLLGVLREDADHEVQARRPQPGVGHLTELLDEAREATGAVTRLIVSGPPVTLDSGVELATYRIVQEALTNARRHAPGAAIDVELRFSDSGLLVRIRDNGPGPPADGPGGGHGLLGMRERAAAVGGELRTGPALSGGFLIEAEMPGRAADLPGPAELQGMTG